MKFLKLLNVLNPIVYYYKYHVRNTAYIDPYKEITKFVEHLPKGNKQIKKILIVPYRVAPGSNLFEGNCAIAFKSRGYQVDSLFCGQTLSHCDQIDSSLSKYIRCNLCFHEQKKFMSAFDVNGIFMHQYISAEELAEINLEVENTSLQAIESLYYRSVPIYRPLHSALQLYYKKATIAIAEEMDVVKGYLKTIYTTIRVLENYFRKNKVELVLLSHGVYSTWGTVQEFCLTHCIKFVTWGRVYHGAGIIAAHNASYLSEPMYEQNSNWNHSPLTTKQREQIISYLDAKVGFSQKTYDYVDYNKNTKLLPKEELFKQLKLDTNKKIIALFPNIPWDGQTFRPNLAFKNINAWLYETIDWISKRDDCTLIIRTHPAESYFKERNLEGILTVLEERYGPDTLPKNIVLIPADSPITSLSVASISNAALLYGSTIGYETIYLRIPTILASEFYYSNKEISFDPKTKDEYFSLINQAIEGTLNVDEARFERLLQYAYHYQFRRVMPETLMKLDGLKFIEYKHPNLQGFLEDKVFNKFIDCCLSEQKFYFDECYE
ncbi:hypothetical protein [Legionella sp. km772]|uniref:hypothetical protein n=1 Tax=Legionella sp. km772 TaxID=2498111 RepID=UPI000F8C94C9|nr:hypothetical protein [Legionella sp. km772]RUR12110.1 hypothetical protein ELY15_06070 [Legionella sp. km772]